MSQLENVASGGEHRRPKPKNPPIRREWSATGRSVRPIGSQVRGGIRGRGATARLASLPY